LDPPIKQRPPPPAILAWTIWGLGAMLYFIAFYQRVAPAVITDELTAAFGLTAAALGNLSAFYFYSYVAMQIPTGILADRWGPRVLLMVGAGVAALGTLVFALAPTLFWANMGRLLIGASVGVAFVSMLKLASHWMQPRQFALASGMALFVGVVGAAAAGAPLRILVDAFGWRHVMTASAVVTLLLTVIIALVVRDDPQDRGYRSYFEGRHDERSQASLFTGFREVFRYRNTALLFFVPGAISSIVLSFAGLWGVPFLVTHYALTSTRAAGLCSLMMIVWALSCLAYGAASDRLGKRKPLFIGGMAITMALWAVMVFVPGLSHAAWVALMVAIGIAGGAFILLFAFAKESVPAHLSGTVSGIANMGVMVGGMVMQPLIGWTLDRHWHGATANGARVYDFNAYQSGFALPLVWGAVSVVLLFFTRETYCRQTP
jgi:nitrate/nitrite transporter NarK